MKGLILKDLYTLSSYGKQYGVIFGAMILYSIAMRSPSFAMIYFVIMGSSMVLSSMSMDEAVSFNRFALTTPINLRMIVKAKYIIFLITIGMGALAGILMEVIMHVIPSQTKVWISFGKEGFAATVTVFILANTFSLPTMFKLGVEKARYVYIFSMLVVGGLIALGSVAGEKIGLEVHKVEELISSDMFVVICIVIGMAALAISYRIAVKISENKEW